MEPIYSPERIWVGCNDGMCDFEWFTDDQEDAELADVEYIRKDKYDELKKSADELADTVSRIANQPDNMDASLWAAQALTAYRKATGDT